MPKKGQTNNPNGRPKLAQRKVYDKQRQLGRVSEAEWAELQAAVPTGVSFTAWAKSVLLTTARATMLTKKKDKIQK